MPHKHLILFWNSLRTPAQPGGTAAVINPLASAVFCADLFQKGDEPL
jgi:hypothetical protein